jgi:hypothetical protein
MAAASPDTIYILSAGHSGSTLLNLILGSHSRATAVSELTNWPADIVQQESCTCGVRAGACPFWRDVAERLRARLGVDVLSNPRSLELGYIDAPRGPYRGSTWYRAMWMTRRIAMYVSLLSGIPLPRPARRRFDLTTENRLAVYDAVRAASGASVVIDASKEYLQGVSVYRARPDRTRLILLIRDGRAVFYSHLKRGFGHAYSLRAWRNTYRNLLPLVRRNVHPEHMLVVRYEELVSDPTQTVRRICAFAGLEFEPAMLDTSSKQHHITSGNNMRFSSARGIRLDRKWQSELRERDREFFERNAGSLNRELGYE